MAMDSELAKKFAMTGLTMESGVLLIALDQHLDTTAMAEMSRIASYFVAMDTSIMKMGTLKLAMTLTILLMMDAALSAKLKKAGLVKKEKPVKRFARTD